MAGGGEDGERASAVAAHGPDEVKDGDAVADGADERVAVGGEDDIALVVHGAAQVGELCAPLG